MSAPDFTISINDHYNRVHQALAYFNRGRLSPSLPSADWWGALRQDQQMLRMEAQFLAQERSAVAVIMYDVPTDAKQFVEWFEALREIGPGQGDELFPWLAETASYEELRWFLLQEVAGEAGFDDLLALTQVKMPTRPKLEMARNYWDEMGRGNEDGMHGPMLSRLAQAMDVHPIPEETVWQSLALSNLMIGLATNRCFAYQSVGALGVIELTAPGRAVHVAQGLRRVGLSGKSRLYFELHATLDIRHSQAWNSEVLAPLVQANPSAAVHIAEGALLRLRAGARCFKCYKARFGLGVSK